MGFYEDRILPRIITKTCGMPAMNKLRRRACEPLSGRVVEIGFGSGFNVGQYPDAVTQVAAVEPSDTGWQLGAERIAASTIPIERSGLDGQRLPFDDDTFDSALSTFTLCTIPDLPAALAELRRVVKPGGVFAFFEHGNAPDEGVRRWQRRLEPLQKRVGGGCHLTRDIPALVSDAGWDVVELDSFYGQVPKTFSAFSVGYARNP
ncbi:class I SAM-dependent methyltransferase [Gordonia sp. (in: high G+C Gram-positive bacteria)]|uniref:class I SAM-dependent methyltransferase n=1 Tax=Gordonia sp. (in: high G+C Gram-positive bacteria) TaxID=84139 RepID=UPI0016B058BA|nr:class I SAM-dependent methyltransferase [Gordonia sp. (in: high G+C Gram-positive bacteria)]NLG47541.1 class I SAM-dependent methyltransferase [Gordonia sp. (in: high G+C Gram-positive bacteria)]